LRALLTATRAAGYAQEDGFVTPGFASVACAVHDHTGHPIAAVAVTYPAPEGDPRALAEHVARAASRVTRGIRGSRT
jgi:DNA-binding IclR family transcriptional regulator